MLDASAVLLLTLTSVKNVERQKKDLLRYRMIICTLANGLMGITWVKPNLKQFWASIKIGHQDKPQCLISVLSNHPTKLFSLQSLTQQQPRAFRRRLKLKINTIWHQQAGISTGT